MSLPRLFREYWLANKLKEMLIWEKGELNQELFRDVQFFGKLLISWFSQDCAIREDNCGDNSVSLIGFYYEATGVGILVDVYPLKRDVVLCQEVPGTATIRAPGGTIKFDNMVRRVMLDTLSHTVDAQALRTESAR